MYAVTVGLLYTRPDGTPFKIAEVSDRRLLREVAAVVMQEAEDAARAQEDAVLAQIKLEELSMLRRALELLLSSEPRQIIQ
jgi:hypothetical protein